VKRAWWLQAGVPLRGQPGVFQVAIPKSALPDDGDKTAAAANDRGADNNGAGGAAPQDEKSVANAAA